MEKGTFAVGEFVNAFVDPVFRRSVRKNHTATHLLHATLRTTLGEHVKQAGSLVAPDRLRFDFTHYTGLKADEVQDLEKKVNEKVLSNLLVETRVSTVEQAVAEGAMALFGEKYGDKVRVVTIGDLSKELCGGTHCGSTGEVGAFLIARESSTAAGVRRIEALTGTGALEYVQQERRLVDELSSALKVSSDELVQRIQDLLERNKKLEKEVERLKSKAMMSAAGDDFSIDREFSNGIRIHLKIFPEADADQLGNFVDELFRSGKYTVVAAGSISNSSLAVRVSDGKDATRLFKNFYVAEFGGGGGGRKDFAKGGLKKLKELRPEDSLNLLLKATSNYLSL
jgi:alanyl-tRNA synthetase